MNTTVTSIHETARRLRALSRHLDRHSQLPPVASLGTDYVAELTVTVAGESGTAGFLTWAATLEHPRVHACGPDTSGLAMLRGTGRIDGDTISLTAHPADLPAGCVRDEPIPLLGFRHLLARAGWTQQPASPATGNEATR